MFRINFRRAGRGGGEVIGEEIGGKLSFYHFKNHKTGVAPVMFRLASCKTSTRLDPLYCYCLVLEAQCS